MEVALIGKAALVASVGNIRPGAQTCFSKLNPGAIEKGDGRQANILLKSADQRLFA